MDTESERRRLAAALLERTGLKVDPDDPAFVLVELNRMVLQEESAKAAEAISVASANANAKLLASADAWASQSNDLLGRFAARTDELRSSLEAAANAAKPTPAPFTPKAPPPPRQSPAQSPGPGRQINVSAVVGGTAALLLIGILVGVGLMVLLSIPK
jgi:hypothetical protein